MRNSSANNYSAHYNPDTKQYQPNITHNSETAETALEKNPIPYLENIIWLICLYHDAGKFTVLWQAYFQDRIKNPENYSGPKEDHTTLGGQLAAELFPASLLSELVQTAIYSHHGLQDCISLEDDISLYTKRKLKGQTLPFDECREQFYKENDKKEIERRCAAAMEEAAALRS